MSPLAKEVIDKLTKEHDAQVLAEVKIYNNIDLHEVSKL